MWHMGACFLNFFSPMQSKPYILQYPSTILLLQYSISFYVFILCFLSMFWTVSIYFGLFFDTSKILFFLFIRIFWLFCIVLFCFVLFSNCSFELTKLKALCTISLVQSNINAVHNYFFYICVQLYSSQNQHWDLMILLYSI